MELRRYVNQERAGQKGDDAKSHCHHELAPPALIALGHLDGGPLKVQRKCMILSLKKFLRPSKFFLKGAKRHRTVGMTIPVTNVTKKPIAKISSVSRSGSPTKVP